MGEGAAEAGARPRHGWPRCDGTGVEGGGAAPRRGAEGGRAASERGAEPRAMAGRGSCATPGPPRLGHAMAAPGKGRRGERGEEEGAYRGQGQGGDGGSATGEPGVGRERDILGGEAHGRGPQRGKWRRFQPPHAQRAWGAGGGWAAEAGWATRGGLAGPPSRPKKERGGEAAAGPRAWLGREPGWAARLAGPQGEGEGREGKTSFSLSTLFAK
jgi:translation initiation factor IF-2